MPPAALISSIASLRADAALLAGVGQRAGDRMQHADLHRRALRAQHGRRMQNAAAAAAAPSAVDCRNRRRLTADNRTRHSFPSVMRLNTQS